MTDETSETIVVTFKDGTVKTYSNCTGYTNNGTVVSFTGQLSGQDPPPKKWELNWSDIRSISRE